MSKNIIIRLIQMLLRKAGFYSFKFPPVYTSYIVVISPILVALYNYVHPVIRDAFYSIFTCTF